MSANQATSGQAWQSWGLIGAVALVAHGALLLNDGVYWDGWLVYWLRHDGNWPELLRWSGEAGGVPFPLLLRWICGSLPNTALGFKLAAFASLALAAVFTYLMASRVHRLSSAESLCLALLALVYPAYQVSVEMNSTKYLVTYALFLAGAYFGCLAESERGARYAGLRVASSCLFVLAFGTSSLLVFYCGYLVLWFAHAIKARQLTRADIAPFLARRADVLLLAPAYRIAVQFFFPSSGAYQGYNSITASPQLLREGYDLFYERSVAAQWSETVGRLGEQPWVAAGALFVAFVVFAGASRARFTPAPAGRHVAVVAFACGLLLLGMLPYVLVGKPAWRHGWSSRHALLVALPVALAVFSAARILCAGRAQVIQRMGFALLGACIWMFTVSSWSYYASWQARWAKDRAIIAHLRNDTTDLRGHSTFWIVDRCPISPESKYEFYEWAGLFKAAWGNESHLGVDVRTPGAQDFVREGTPYFNQRYQLSTFNPAGGQATLTIECGPAAGDEASLALRYWRARFLEPETMPEFLRSVVTVSVREGAAELPWSGR